SVVPDRRSLSGSPGSPRKTSAETHWRPAESALPFPAVRQTAPAGEAAVELPKALVHEFQQLRRHHWWLSLQRLRCCHPSSELRERLWFPAGNLSPACCLCHIQEVRPDQHPR